MMPGSPLGKVNVPAEPTGNFEADPIKVPLAALATVVGVAWGMVVVVEAPVAKLFVVDELEPPKSRPRPAVAPAKTTLPAATREAITTRRRSSVATVGLRAGSTPVPRSTGQRSGPQVAPLRWALQRPPS